MTIRTITTRPIDGQTPGTSGLRKPASVFKSPGYLENYVQSIFDGIGGGTGKSVVIGGDGRYFNSEAIQTILRIAAGNGVARAIVGQNGLLSTPAASHLIRKRGTDGGIILSASHNPGGPDGDFGVKYNISNGGPAPGSVTDRITRATTTIDSYSILDAADVDLSALGIVPLGDMVIEIVDPVADYALLMESLFDFNAIQSLIADGFTLRFDAMHAITGPYATAILEDRLGAPRGSVVNGVPLPDFGGGHPDPNPIWARELFDVMMSDAAPDFGAASDGDGDRNMIMGRGIYVTPSDSLALLTARATEAPAFAGGLRGVARSMPTSRAVDRVAEAMNLECHVTPTGWKYFGTLLDAGRATLCGEESAGTGSDHVREKDGLWAVLLWLNILAKTRRSVADLMADHWARFGRTYYSRHDYEGIDAGAAADLMADLRAALPTLPGTKAGALTVTQAGDFSYTDPVDGSTATGQGLQIDFDRGARIVFRLSGTGTQGATLRVYLETFDAADPARNPAEALGDVTAAAEALAGLRARTGRDAPDVIT